MSDRQSLLGSHQQSWWFNEINYDALLADSEVEAVYIIALAYVLSQPFEAFALIGPRFISETASSFESLKIQLTSSELKWLNLEQNVRPK